jgi:hypothetical protein
MRVLSIMLVLLLAAQPLAARYCDMEPSDSAAQHAGMQHGSDAEDPGHACCDSPAAQPDRECDGLSHCAACVVGMTALPVHQAQLLAPGYAYRMPLTESRVPPSHSSPPYRPPTAIS